MAIIGWSIVGFFGITMFSGSVFFGFDAIKNRDKTQSVESSGQFISLGNYDVDIRYFYSQYQTTISQYTQQSKTVSPIIHEQILMQAFGYAVNRQAYYIAAQEENIVVVKEDVDAIEQETLLQANFKNRSELKKELKKQQVKYKDFRAQLQQDALIRKFQIQYVNDINIDRILVENSFKQFKIDYIIVDNKALSLEQLEEQSIGITRLLNEGKSVSDLQTIYEGIVSINSFLQPDYQDYLTFDFSVRDQLGNVDVNTYIDPYCRDSSCGIIQVLDIKLKDKPLDYDDETYAVTLKNQLQEEKLRNRINAVYDAHPIVVYDSVLKAVYYKSQQKYFDSLNSYQELLSLNPSDPAPHFFRAEIFVQQGNIELALEELEKAVLKVQMMPDTAFVELHVFYADLLLESNRRADGFSQYELAYNLAENSIEYLTFLKERYQLHSFNDALSKFDDRISVLELAAKEQAEKDRKDLAELLEKKDKDVTPSVVVSDSENRSMPVVSDKEN
tara:strand:+ start:2088 stop:3593 length:1506 start_codon:yes stop_codon:yes gene_type:complete